MGVYYYIVDRGSRRTFQLGKGLWYEFDAPPFPNLSPVEVRKRVHYVLIDDESTEPPDYDNEYIAKVSVDVYAFLRSCERGADLRCDTQDYDDECVNVDGRWVTTLIEVGSRYEGYDIEPDPLADAVARYRAEAVKALVEEAATGP